MPSPPRTRRRFVPTRKIRAEASEMHGWAVSYSDLLMVLLAFFVLYFNFGEKSTANILRSVVTDLDKSGHTQAESAAGTQAPKRGTAAIPDMRNEMSLSGFVVDKASVKGSITVHLPDNIYGPGAYEVGKKHHAPLKKLLEILSPYKDSVELVFIGHTDAQAVRQDNRKVIDSNLVLSNLRGARAAEFALLRGYNPALVSSEGVGQFRRQTRSLSVRINERKD